MKEFTYVITDPAGMHARPAGEFAKTAKGFSSSVKISKNGKAADAKKLFGIMSLGVKQGEEVLIQVEGEDEAAATPVLEAFLKENL